MGRIFLGLNQVGGHLWGLHQGFAELGVASEVFNTTQRGYMEFPCTRDLSWISALPAPCRALSMGGLLAGSCLEFDLFHFSDGRSFFPGAEDIGLLKKLGKKVFFTFNGTSTRSKAYCLAHYRYSQYGHDGVEVAGWSPDEERLARKFVRMHKFADGVFCVNPDLCNQFPGSTFLPYAKYGVQEISGRKRDFLGSKRLRIAHAPTNRAVKGTNEFFSALKRVLPDDAYEPVFIEGLSNKAALEAISSCDILFDQLYAGWYGGVAVEAMALGLPVLCYIRKEDLVHVEPAMRDALPICNVEPHTLETDLEIIFGDKASLAARSEAGMDFVHRFHSPSVVAGTVLAAYRAAGLDPEAP